MNDVKGLHILQIKETCIYSRDLPMMMEFYHGLLGLEVIHHLPGKHVFFRAGTSVLLCFNPDDSRQKVSPPPHYAEGKYHFAFEVAAHTYEAHKEEVRRLGIPILDEVTWQNGRKSFYFEDPAGNVLEIVPEGIW
jgi:catechol 2,3-dioxygenase-like lactoylglutathione lyase family enzyme